MSDKQSMWSFCRKCGGDRVHKIEAVVDRAWQDPEAPVDGGSNWSILECGGCETITCRHSHWFSEDTEPSEEGIRPIEHVDLYPPAPSKKMPDWASDFVLDVGTNEIWIDALYKDIYATAGMKMYSIAAMGTRAIVDHIVTSQAGAPPSGKSDTFKKKVKRLEQGGKLTPLLASFLLSTFDASSAAAHRGFAPSEKDFFTILDIAENLIEVIYILPAREKARGTAASALKARTPKRTF